MPLSDYSELELLEELSQRATKRTELALEGTQNGDLSKVSYREVVPVEGQPVPPGCMFRSASSDWIDETFSHFSAGDEVRFSIGWKWRAPVSPEVGQ